MNPTDFICSTSGSTGAPKRVIISDAAFLAMAKVDAADLGLNSRSTVNIDRWGIGGWRKVFWARVSGCRLAMYPGHDKISLRTWILDQQITHLSLLATTLRWVCQGIYKYPTVELLEIGGELVDWGDVRLARSRFPNAVFVNRYNSSECNDICRKRIELDQPTGDGLLPVGKPVKGVELQIINGEIVVKSPYCASGYYDNPELTAVRFRDGWVYTGDQGELLPNGEVICRGRAFQGRLKPKFIAESESTHDDRVAKWSLAGG